MPNHSAPGAEQYPAATWQLWVQPQPTPGALNMALDEALLQTVAAGGPPALRLYTWQPGLSMGRSQPLAEIDLAALERSGHSLVRRLSGGSAVWHGHELAFCAVGPLTEPRLAGGILARYQRFNQVLLQALKGLGVPGLASVPHPENRRRHSPACFELAADYEVTAQGRKLVGCAQVQRGAAVLLHGSIPLEGDSAAVCAYLRHGPAPDELRAWATTLSAAVGHPLAWETVAAAVIESCQSLLNLRWTIAPVPPEVWAIASELQQKYASPAWNARPGGPKAGSGEP